MTEPLLADLLVECACETRVHSLARMRPYVIRQGDYLAKLAHVFGFDADAVWNDPKNEALRALRKDPNVLWPTDVLYIPNPGDTKAAAQELNLGETNTFVSPDPPTVSVSLQLKAQELQSRAYSIVELPRLSGLTTDGTGTARFDVPVTQRVVTLVFSHDGSTFVCGVGDLDPINTLSGIRHRLLHLGYLPSDVELDSVDVGQVRDALRALKASQSGNDGPSDGSTDQPSPTDSSTPDDCDDAGLSDDGELDDSTSALLVAAHGI